MMAPSVLIIDCTGKPYNSANHTELALGGIERAVIQLAGNFVRRGMSVSVWNDTPEPVVADGVSWIPKNKPNLVGVYDIVIACNDSKLFDEYFVASGHRNFKPYLWFHNRVQFGKTLRKGRMMPMFRWRPVGVFLGADHERTGTKMIPLKRRVIIGHGVEDEILNYASANKNTRPQVAVFISQPYRGLAEMIELWRNIVHPALPEARFRIYAAQLKDVYKNGLPDEALAKAGIEVRGRMPRRQLMKELEEARVCLIPGHPDETFCLAAAEALAMHIPVLTYGTGSLKERVDNGKNGFVVSSQEDFTSKLRKILTDDVLWQALSAASLTGKSSYSWHTATQRWMDLIGETRH
jgi:glycosyltransferase involved in cell wall biosynthesis